MAMENQIDAWNVTANCITDIGNGDPIKPERILGSYGIDNPLIKSLKTSIASDESIGLPSVLPDAYTIDPDLLTISELSTVNEVFINVFNEAVKAHVPSAITKKAPVSVAKTKKKKVSGGKKHEKSNKDS